MAMTTPWARWLLIGALTTVSTSEAVGRAPDEAASITGTVVDGVTGKPVEGAKVTLKLYQYKWCEPCFTESISPDVMTTRDGHFAFKKILPKLLFGTRVRGP